MFAQGFHRVEVPCQFSLPEQTVDLAVADGMERHRLPSAFEARDKVVLFPALSKRAFAQGTEYFNLVIGHGLGLCGLLLDSE